MTDEQRLEEICARHAADMRTEFVPAHIGAAGLRAMYDRGELLTIIKRQVGELRDLRERERGGK